jgi:hypothetical protein
LSQTSRANFKTLAAGGTSGAGGTGIRYPWAIAAGDSSFRIQISRVRISRAWDGITSNNFNAVFWLDDVEMSAFDCGLSLGEGPTGIQDFCHINAYHFWNFDFADSDPLFSVFADGNTIAMRVGRVDGLDIKGFTSLMGRLVVTPDSAGATSIHIANCMLDTDQATIDINGDMLQFQISNMYGVAGTGRLRPLVSVNAACNLNITNYYSHSTSNFSEFLLTNDNAIVGITNFRAMFYTTNIPWAEVRQGFLRITNGYLFTPARTVAAIAETVNGRLVVDNITVTASGGATTGPLISMVTANAQSSIGRLALDPAAAWTFTIPAGVTQQFYSPQTQFFGAVFGKSLIQAGVATGGSQGTVAITGAAGEQKALMYQRGANPGWGIMAQGASDDLNIARWDNAGTFLGNALSINRAAGTTTFGSGISFGSTTVTGVDLSRHVSLYDGYAGFNVTSGAMNFVITGTVPLSVIGSAAGLAMPLLRTSTSFANDAAAATGGVPVGGIYRNASQVMVRVT